MAEFRTPEERFWAGQFGDEYVDRNHGPELLASNLAFFRSSLRCAVGLESCIELGANIGMNLRALKLLYPKQKQTGVEINPKAAEELETFLGRENVHRGSILDFHPEGTYDLVLLKGVLIHVNPESLAAIYDVIYRSAHRYILIAEYYNPTPVMIPYRGHQERLYKRDFCGELLDRFSTLSLLDYGFAYRRDPSFPQDDINWFLIERKG